MHSELCCLETYAGAIHFIFTLGCSCLPAWWCKQNGSRDCRSSIEACVLQVNVTLLYHPKEAQKSLSQTFKLNVPSRWNDLPNSIRAAESLPIFKKRLKHNASIFIWPSNSSTLYSNSILKKKLLRKAFILMLVSGFKYCKLSEILNLCKTWNNYS